MKIFTTIIVLSLLSGPFSWGWGKRGHEIVESVAARILEERKEKLFFAVTNLIWVTTPMCPISFGEKRQLRLNLHNII